MNIYWLASTPQGVDQNLPVLCTAFFGSGRLVKSDIMRHTLCTPKPCHSLSSCRPLHSIHHGCRCEDKSVMHSYCCGQPVYHLSMPLLLCKQQYTPCAHMGCLVAIVQAFVQFCVLKCVGSCEVHILCCSMLLLYSSMCRLASHYTRWPDIAPYG